MESIWFSNIKFYWKYPKLWRRNMPRFKRCECCDKLRITTYHVNIYATSCKVWVCDTCAIDGYEVSDQAMRDYYGWY